MLLNFSEFEFQTDLVRQRLLIVLNEEEKTFIFYEQVNKQKSLKCQVIMFRLSFSTLRILLLTWMLYLIKDK